MPAKKKATKKKRTLSVPKPDEPKGEKHLAVADEVYEELNAIGDAWSTIRAITVRESGRLGK